MATKKRVTKDYKKASLKEIANNPNDVGIPADWEGWKRYSASCDEPETEIPHLRGGDWKWNFEKEDNFDKGTVVGYESAASDFKRVNRITWVLTVVNVAILIIIIIKNV